MQVIRYNPQADPKQYRAQLVNNLVDEILGTYEAQRQSRELQGIGQWAGRGFQGQMPAATTDVTQQIVANLTQQRMLNPFAAQQAKANLGYTRARTEALKTPKPATLSPIMRMVQEGLITHAEGRKLARKDADDDLGEKDIISIMHTIERALEATYDAIGSPIPDREDQRKYYVEQLEHYESRLDEYRSARTKRGGTESFYDPSNPPLENLPLGTLEVNRTAPIAPRPYLNSYWGNLDDETKSLVTRAITKGATQIEILEALRARGAIR